MKKIETSMEIDYSAVIDILIIRGIHFLSVKKTDKKKINDCEDFFVDLQEYKEFNDDFQYGLFRLEERVDIALKLLQSDKLLWLAPYSDNIGREDAILRDQIREVMPILDDVTFLREALFSWQSVKELACHGDWLQEVDVLLARIGEVVAEMSCRLIPLNDYRREQLQSINPLFHPLFSWYEEEADVPATALEKMVELMIDHPKRELPASLAELRERLEIMDPELHENVHRRVRASRIFFDTLEQFPELRWEMARQVIAGTTPLASQIVAAGLHRTVEFSVYRRIVSPVPALEWRFLAAFCAPNLDAKQRQRTFAEVKNRLESGLADTHNSSVLASVKANLCDRLGDEELARELFVEWCSGREYGLEKTAVWLLELPSLPEIDPNQLARLLDMSDKEAVSTARAKLYA